jgi:Na+/melibiose symporter-like transporter
MLVCVYPAVFGLASALVLLGYSLGEKKVQQISTDLAQRRQPTT